jgi:hypothetical protein
MPQLREAPCNMLRAAGPWMSAAARKLPLSNFWCASSSRNSLSPSTVGGRRQAEVCASAAKRFSLALEGG